MPKFEPKRNLAAGTEGAAAEAANENEALTPREPADIELAEATVSVAVAREGPHSEGEHEEGQGAGRNPDRL